MRVELKKGTNELLKEIEECWGEISGKLVSREVYSFIDI